MKEKWSAGAWRAAENHYKEILELPFIKEMAAGTLGMDRFLCYIRQDNLYINEYCRVLAHIASRLPDFADVETFLGFGADGVAVEKGLHAMYTNEENAPAMSDACLLYTSFLKAQAYQDVAVEAASILPCFWVYQKVGEHQLATYKKEDNPYADWIACYSDPAFDISTQKAIDICDRLAEDAGEAVRRRMTEVFVECTRLERVFWQSAYDGNPRFLEPDKKN